MSHPQKIKWRYHCCLTHNDKEAMTYYHLCLLTSYNGWGIILAPKDKCLPVWPVTRLTYDEKQRCWRWLLAKRPRKEERQWLFKRWRKKLISVNWGASSKFDVVFLKCAEKTRKVSQHYTQINTHTRTTHNLHRLSPHGILSHSSTLSNTYTTGGFLIMRTSFLHSTQPPPPPHVTFQSQSPSVIRLMIFPFPLNKHLFH